MPVFVNVCFGIFLLTISACALLFMILLIVDRRKKR
jgi:hypothetical protein